MDQASQIETFKKNSQLCVDYICNHVRKVPFKPVSPDVIPGYLRELLPGWFLISFIYNLIVETLLWNFYRISTRGARGVLSHADRFR